jgi:AraC family transcriptional activator of pobA
VEGTRSSDQDLLRRFRGLVERHYAQHHSIARHARALGVSEQRLRRCCLALTDHSPGELQHLRQLREAQRQLHYTARPIARIALDLGFADPAYFSRFFTRRIGVSPRQYRKRADSAAAADLQ